LQASVGLIIQSVRERPLVELGVVGEFSGSIVATVKSNAMKTENVHWTSIRRGDLIVVGENTAVVVAGVDMLGAVWDVNGDSWHSSDEEGRVTRLEPLSQYDKHMARQIAFNHGFKRKIRVEVRGAV
jgi:hypothetical protein